MVAVFQNPCRIVEISKRYVFLTALIIKISSIFNYQKLLHTKYRIHYLKIHHLSSNIRESKKKALSGKLQKYFNKYKECKCIQVVKEHR